MLGHDAHNRQGIQKGVERLREVQFHHGVGERLGALHTREVGLSHLARANGVYRKGDVMCRERHAVAEDSIISDLERPGQMIGRAFV